MNRSRDKDGRRPVLPVEATTFVGRQAEVARIRSMLRFARLITCTGIGGVGKSRLAQRAAAQAGADYPDGVVLIKLDEVDDPRLVATVTARAFGLGDSPLDPVSAIARHLRDKSALLLLDSCEHVVEGCRPLVRAILAAAPDVRLLVTSQRPLEELGERLMQVLPLSVPETDDIDQAASSEAVRLFADRAAAAHPGFTIDADSRNTVVQVCRRLDGVPLAIELAAAWLRVLPLPEILSRLDDRLLLLTKGSPLAPVRQRSLRAALAWSHDLCGPTERTLWARMSVFRGGFDLAAAEAVCACDEIEPSRVRALVASLVRRSVVLAERGQGGVRYRLLDAVREFGWQRLVESGEDECVLERHGEHYRRFVDSCERSWRRTHQQLEVCERLFAEMPNIRSAMQRHLDAPARAAAGLHMAARLYFYWLCCGALVEGLRWTELAVERAPAPTHDRAVCAWVAVVLATRTATHEAPSRLADIEAWAAANDDDAMLARVHATMAVYASVAGDTPRAIALANQAAARFAAHTDLVNDHLTTLAMLSRFQITHGQVDEGLATAEDALAHLDEAGGDNQLPQSYLGFSAALGLWRQGDMAAAEATVLSGLRTAAAYRDTFGAVELVELLVWVEAGQGRHGWAAELLGVGAQLWSLMSAPQPLLARELAEWRAEAIDHIREALGPAEYEAAENRGRRAFRTLEDAFERIVQGPRGALPEPKSAVSLTKREQQVAALVAGGSTNRQVAEQLGIAQRTAETHVDRILRKLGLTSRTQLASWLSTHGH